MSVNKVIILGRLGQDPELKYTPTGSAVCSFSLATSESWTDKAGQKQERTEWHRIVVWGKLGELCNQYLGKGRQAYIEGRLQTRSWDGKDGQKRYTTEINASTVQFLDGPRSNTQGGAQVGAPGQRQQNSGAPMSSDYSHPMGGSVGGDFMDQNYQVSADANFTADDVPF